jgi:hydroxyacylglutathione hydrolase
MYVHPVTVGDNYAYLLTEGRRAAVVDPSAARPLIDLAEESGVVIDTVLITHHHADHTAGCAELKSVTGCKIAGPPGGYAADRTLSGGDIVETVGTGFRVIPVPGHTRHHVCYHAPDEEVLFTGDTLFVAGCGRPLVASAAELWHSLLKLRALPDRTKVYVGHEYTLDNLEFALTLEPGKSVLRRFLGKMRERIEKGLPTVPSSIGAEKEVNPFLRADSPAIAAAVGLAGEAPEKVFSELRARKNRW